MVETEPETNPETAFVTLEIGYGDEGRLSEQLG
jgi:hypothetical protein